ncbi:MAG: hypothetical protein JNM22_01675 [Saprospiraceae bacterium]|nr:hypothetical protein [Saprospiraceae bacterium]
MGWKASTIIINRPTKVDNEELLKTLGFDNLTKIEDELFENAINPDDNKVYIGTYKNNLLICTQGIPMQFFEEHETQTEKTLNQIFPNSEICSIVLHSTINLWGYSVIQNRQKIRARAGSADDGTFVEIGEPLEEEKELLSKSKLDDNGNRIYLLDNFPDEPLNEDQVGEIFVFSICKRYFGDELDSADDLLFETTLTGYKYGKVKQTTSTQQTNKTGSLDKIDKTKPWWKFW